MLKPATTIRQMREDLGLTQTRFAEAVVEAAANEGVELTLTRFAVSNWERDDTGVALRYRPWVGMVLGIDHRLIWVRAGVAA